MNNTGISWTDYTWNPVSGCTKVSEGCKFCYAEEWSKRWHRSFQVQLHPEKLKEVKRIPSGSKVFVNSMSDLFHPDVSNYFLYLAFIEMKWRKDVIFQILTKRPERMQQFFRSTGQPIMSNMWLGVSVESPSHKDRISKLVEVFSENQYESEKASVSFVSFEPLLGDIGTVDLSHISWVIIGGESGPYHRPMEMEWARNIVRQAKEQNVAVWMKQLGGLRPGGKLEDFPEDLRIREFPNEMKMMEAAVT